MGIDVKICTIWGIKTEWDDSFNDDYEEIEHHLREEFGYNGPHPSDMQVELLSDGMCCEYMVFGIVLYDSGNLRYWEHMNNFEEIDTNGLGEQEKEYKEKFKKLYPDHYHLVDKPFKLINIIHYY